MNDDERMPPPGPSPDPGRRPQPEPARGSDLEPVPSESGLPPAESVRNHSAVEKPRGEGSLNLDVVSQPQPGSAPPPAPTRTPAAPDAVVEGPSPDVALAEEASPLPGAHRGGFRRLPTAPIPVTVQSAPVEPGTEEEAPSAQWLASGEPAMHRGLAGWALAFAIVGLVVSLFVGWGFPIGLVAVISAILALRRPLESRAMGVWAIAIGVVSILYSAGWLLYAATRANLLG